jgi:hypothetical protein
MFESSNEDCEPTCNIHVSRSSQKYKNAQFGQVLMSTLLLQRFKTLKDFNFQSDSH